MSDFSTDNYVFSNYKTLDAITMNLDPILYTFNINF